jgi:hypothetical protein
VIYTVVGFSPSVENLKANWAPMRPVRIVRVKKLVSICKIIIICGIAGKREKDFIRKDKNLIGKIERYCFLLILLGLISLWRKDM